MTSYAQNINGDISGLDNKGQLISKTRTKITVPLQILFGILCLIAGIVIYFMYIRPHTSEIVFDLSYYMETLPEDAFQFAWAVPISLFIGTAMLISGLFRLRTPNIAVYENGIEKVRSGKNRFFRWEEISYVTAMRYKITRYYLFIPYSRKEYWTFTLYTRDQNYFIINSDSQGNVDKNLDDVLHEKTLPHILDDYCKKLAGGETITLHTSSYPSLQVNITPDSVQVGKELARWEHIADWEIREDEPEYLYLLKKDGTKLAIYGVGFPNFHVITPLIDHRIKTGGFRVAS